MNRGDVVTGGLGATGAGVAILNPLVAEITQALLDLGGAAHRDLVVAYIAKQRGIYRPPEALRRELGDAFAAYCDRANDPRSPSLLHLPYGPFSHRWALTDKAYGLLRGGTPVGARRGARTGTR
jgi:hypothetical protein